PGVTAATGSGAKRMIASPMAAFQKPITYQGSVTANSTTRTRSTQPKPPGESAITASQTRPAMVRPTAAKNATGRQAGTVVGEATAISSRGERSSMEWGRACLLRRFEDIGACGRRQSVCRYPRTPSRPGMKMQGKALWYVAPGRAELRAEEAPVPKAGEVCVRALYGAISRGTERLVHAGRGPARAVQRMPAPAVARGLPL